ncbi:MAG: GldG family protein [Methylacidiphilales bacterium]|nr:GldG family protein [Candidatus Methylacidiphilales bacterium]
MKNDTPSARSSRRSAGLQSVINLLLVLGILIIVNYIGFVHYDHRDLSSSQFYTLSPKTEDVLKKLTSPLTIYTYLDLSKQAQDDQIATLLKEYERVGGKNVLVEKIDPNYDINRAVALQKQLKFDGNDHLIIFSYKDAAPRFVKQDDLYETNPMTGQSNGFKGEQLFTSTILSLIEGKVSKVYFTVGHGEHPLQDLTAPNGYGLVGQGLKNENVETDNLNLAQKGDVPSDADAVVIAGPVVSFSPMEADALGRYLANKGKLFILLDPFVTSGLDDVLKNYGLKFESDLVLYRSGSVVTETGTVITIPLALIYQGGFSSHPITSKFAQANYNLQIADARSVTLLSGDKSQANPSTQFLLQTDPDAWGWVNNGIPQNVDIKQLTFNKATDIPGPVTVAAAYDGGMTTDPTTKATVPATRIVVVGASKFIENDNAEQVGANFFTNCVDWLVKKEPVLDINPKKPLEYGISLMPMETRTIFWTALVFIPGAALLAGIFTWFSRRK